MAVSVLGIGAAAAAGWLTQEVAPYLMLGCIVVGSAVVGWRYSRALFRPQPRKGEPAESSLPA